MERLTDRTQVGPWASLIDKSEAKPGAFADYDCLMAHMEAVTRLKYYEDMEEQGRLVVLPSAVGGKVYRIVAIECEGCPSYDGKTNIRDWTCDQDKCPQIIVEDRFDMWMLKMVGRLVFASRSEAEAALAAKGG